LKTEIRVIGIDNGNTRLRRRLVAGVVFRGGLWLDGVVTSIVDVAASSLGRRLALMVTRSKFYNELRVAMLHGSILGSMDAADFMAFRTTVELPTIAILEGKQIHLVRQIVKKARKAVHFRPQEDLSVLGMGLTAEKAVEILKITSHGSIVPEPVRVAGIIASAMNTPKRLNWTLRPFRGGS